MTARSSSPIPGHENREIYYKYGDHDDSYPPIRKVVVDHNQSPGVVTSAFRTSKPTKDGVIIYLNPNMSLRNFMDGTSDEND